MSVDSIFSTPLFAAPGASRQNQAALGFTQVFAAMLAKQMRSAMAGEGQGPLGIGSGTSGDIYGSFFDQAMGQALAASPALKPLNQAIERELAGPRHPLSARTLDAATAPNLPISSRPAVTQHGTAPALPADSQGPLLLPPDPASVASLLPPPAPLEG